MEKDAERRAEFRKWFLRQWAEWDKSEGRRSTQLELARHIGIGRSALAQYVAGRQVPDGDNLFKIGNVFGFEVYEILGVEPPRPLPFDGLPPGFADRLFKASTEAANTLASMQIDSSSAEAQRVTREVFERYGFSSTDTASDKDLS